MVFSTPKVPTTPPVVHVQTSVQAPDSMMQQTCHPVVPVTAPLANTCNSGSSAVQSPAVQTVMSTRHTGPGTQPSLEPTQFTNVVSINAPLLLYTTPVSDLHIQKSHIIIPISVLGSSLATSSGVTEYTATSVARPQTANRILNAISYSAAQQPTSTSHSYPSHAISGAKCHSL